MSNIKDREFIIDGSTFILKFPIDINLNKQIKKILYNWIKVIKSKK